MFLMEWIYKLLYGEDLPTEAPKRRRKK